MVDVLGKLIDKAKEVGLIEGFAVGRNRVSVSHLQFANDLYFFFLGMSINF